MAEEMRINRYLARCGLGSRRGCEDLITSGRVCINGKQVTQLAEKVNPDIDTVTCDGNAIKLPKSSVTIMLHKPAGYVTTMHDPQGRPCVSSLVPMQTYPSLYPVGRLDCDTTGLLLFSTDGVLGHGLLHPKHHVQKTYYALVDGIPTESELQMLRSGVVLDDGKTLPAQVSLLRGVGRTQALSAIGDDLSASGFRQSHTGKRSRSKLQKSGAVLEIAISEGRKRQVKRMCNAIHHPVIALHRPQFGPLRLGDLERGSWRELNDDELTSLLALVEDAAVGSSEKHAQ